MKLIFCMISILTTGAFSMEREQSPSSNYPKESLDKRLEKNKILQKVVRSHSRSPSPKKQEEALRQFENHWKEATTEVERLISFIEQKNIGETTASKKVFAMHYQKARFSYIEIMRATEPDAAEWYLHEEADKKCIPLRKMYEQKMKGLEFL